MGDRGLPASHSWLESHLLAAGEAALRAAPRLMAVERRGGREQGGSDPIDALAVACIALRKPGLPVARLDGRVSAKRAPLMPQGQPIWRCTSSALDGPGSAAAICGPGIDGSMMPSSSHS